VEHVEPMYEIVGESGTQDGEGCLRDIAVVSVALLALGVLAAVAWVWLA